MTRYRAGRILERGEVLLPEGLQWGTSRQRCVCVRVFFSCRLSESWLCNINFGVSSHSGELSGGGASLGISSDGCLRLSQRTEKSS